jgi:hypothetical protein
MSGYTMTQGELLFSYDVAATISVVSASAVTITAGWPEIAVPGGFFSNVGSVKTSSLHMHFGGLLLATATVPTFVFGVAMSSASPASFPAPSGTNIVATTTSQTPTASTGSFFEADLHMELATPLGIGGASTVRAHGMMWCDTFASPFFVSFPPKGTTFTPTCTIWDWSIQQYLWPYILLGAATAGNQVTLEYLKLYGEN